MVELLESSLTLKFERGEKQFLIFNKLGSERAVGFGRFVPLVRDEEKRFWVPEDPAPFPRGIMFEIKFNYLI